MISSIALGSVSRNAVNTCSDLGSDATVISSLTLACFPKPIVVTLTPESRSSAPGATTSSADPPLDKSIKALGASWRPDIAKSPVFSFERAFPVCALPPM